MRAMTETRSSTWLRTLATAGALGALAVPALPRAAEAAEPKEIWPQAATFTIGDAGNYALADSWPVPAGVSAIRIELAAPGPVSIDLQGFQIRSAGHGNVLPVAIEVAGAVTDFPLTVKNGAIVGFYGGALVASDTPTVLESAHVIFCGSIQGQAAVDVGPASQVRRCRFDDIPLVSVRIAGSGIVEGSTFKGGTTAILDRTVGLGGAQPTKNLLIEGCTFNSQTAASVGAGVLRGNTVSATQYGFIVERRGVVADNSFGGVVQSVAAIKVGGDGRLTVRGNEARGFYRGIEFDNGINARCTLAAENNFNACGQPWNFAPGLDVDNLK